MWGMGYKTPLSLRKFVSSENSLAISCSNMVHTEVELVVDGSLLYVLAAGILDLGILRVQRSERSVEHKQPSIIHIMLSRYHVE